ncbi:SacI homology domain-containing protein [Cunninghamella echinulata]|nr:SacI homology domain-containing protein [Cunninghamella echinulata]
MKLYTTKSSFVVEQDDQNLQKLLINRETGSIELTDSVPNVSEQLAASVIYGIAGFIKLQSGEYLIVITSRENVGAINNSQIYRATAFEIIPLATSLTGLSSKQQKDESSYLDLLQQHLKSGAIYYSHGFDVTQSLQRQENSNASDPVWKRVDERFHWNKFISEKLTQAATIDSKYNDFVIPLLQGFIELNETKVNGKSFVLGLITRRSRHRPGTRYFSRGVDVNGNVSNYVETEQVVLYEDAGKKHQLSYVQTRGSIPVYWAQLINLKYTPRLWVGDSKKSAVSARAHFDQQISIYGPQILVNLVNTKGYELPMAQAYANVVKQLNDPRLYYTHFDFHKECSKMRWHRIQLLVEELKDRLIEQSYYHKSGDDVVKKQTSVIRTNCMDCLDRTNVVQSTFAKHVLIQQLIELDILSGKDDLDKQVDFTFMYRGVWADNADRVSCMYSGTGALKTDFTRTGQRTKAGALQDFQNSVTRYVMNNFMDGNRQDAYDLFLGNYQVSKGASSPYANEKPLRVRAVPPIVVFALIMLILTLLRPTLFGTHSLLAFLAIFLFWLSVLVSAIKFALRHSEQFVDHPHLLGPPKADNDNNTTEKL